LTPEIDRKIISLLSHGTSYRDIQNMYDMNVSLGTLNAITDQLLSELKEWRERPLVTIRLCGWMDAIHYKIKDNATHAKLSRFEFLWLSVFGCSHFLTGF